MDKVQAWWAGLAPREHILLAIAGGLTLLFVFAFGLIAPVQKAHSNAHSVLEATTKDYILVKRTVNQLDAGASQFVGKADDIDQFRLMVTQTAKQNALSITRLQSADDNSLQIILDTADPTRLYAWLEELSTLPGGVISGATIEGLEGGQVQAVIELVAASS